MRNQAGWVVWLQLTMHRFYDVAALPGSITELREEIQDSLALNRGVFSSNALQSMKKLDSFLKETLRLYPATMGKTKATGV